MKPIFIDLAPAYIPFVIQCKAADEEVLDPTVDSLVIYEEGGDNATFDATTISGSPFDPGKVNSKTGLWGVMVPKSAFTVGKWYIALWEVTVDGVVTAHVDTYFVCNHGTAGISGINTVTVTIYEHGTTTPIPDYTVGIWNNDESILIQSGFVSNSIGQFSANLNDGTYKLHGNKAGFTADNTAETFTVSSSLVTKTIYATRADTVSPPALGAIRVYEYCFKQDGVTPMETADIHAVAKIISLPYNYNGRYHSGQEISGTYSVSIGKVYWDIAPGAFVEFNIRHMMKSIQQRHVPLTDTDNEIRLADLLE